MCCMFVNNLNLANPQSAGVLARSRRTAGHGPVLDTVSHQYGITHYGVEHGYGWRSRNFK